MFIIRLRTWYEDIIPLGSVYFAEYYKYGPEVLASRVR